MRWMAVVASAGALAVFGCGSDGDGGSVQDELAELLVEEAALDDECVRSKANQLSDDQAQFLIDNVDAERPEEFDADLRIWVDALSECIVVPEETGDRGRFADEADGVRAVVADCFVTEASDGSRRYSTTIEVDNGADAALAGHRRRRVRSRWGWRERHVGSPFGWTGCVGGHLR